MTTGLFLLRAKQMGFSMDELEKIEEGMVIDAIMESANDQESDSYRQVASQKDFDSF